MEIKTKYNIGDLVYLTGFNTLGSIMVNKYIITDIIVFNDPNDNVKIEYTLQNHKYNTDEEVVGEECEYLFTNIDDALTYIKNYLEKGE